MVDSLQIHTPLLPLPKPSKIIHVFLLRSSPVESGLARITNNPEWKG